MVGKVKQGITPWRGGGAKQSHSGLLRGSACLTPVTGYTSTNHIFPIVFATLVSWDNMVKGKLPGFLPTVLTGVSVTMENLKAG